MPTFKPLKIEPPTADGIPFTIYAEPNYEPICRVQMQEMRIELAPHFINAKGPLPGSGHPARPKDLPGNAVFLVAKRDAASDIANGTSGGGDDIELSDVIGCIAVYALPVDDAAYKSLFEGVGVGIIVEIKRLSVSKAFRRSGVAAALVNAAEQVAKVQIGAGCVVLETLPTMTGARILYERHGYAERGHYGYYDVRDSVFYQKLLG